MKKIGLFLDEIKDKNIDEKQKFSKLGFNTGNMLFWHSLKTQLNLDVRSRWYIDHIDQLDLSEYKAFITTDLIWIRQMQDFSYLNKTLDVIGSLPLIPISIGLQCNSYLTDFKLHPETVKILKRISERCVMGVRGNYTASILEKYEIQNFKVIGCPSMYMNTPGLLTVGNGGQPRNVTMNFETFYSKLDENRINLLEYGMENDFSFVEQAQAELAECHIKDKKRLASINAWINDKRKCFFELDEWRRYIREYDFSIGSRFHGNVLALWENVPALFITCDSRTQELCEHFSLPNIDVSQFDKSKPVEYYYELADYSEFHKNYENRLKEWRGFLEVNELVKKRKALYVCYFPTAFIQSYVHRCTDSSELDAIIIAYNNIKHNDELNSIFSNTVYADDLHEVHYCDDEKIIEDKIKEYYDNILKDNDISLDEIDEIYFACDMVNDFAIYLSLYEKEYSYFEIYKDQFNKNRTDLYDYHIINKNVHGSSAYFKIAKKHLSICGTNSLCKKRYLMPESIENNNKDEKIDFSYKLLQLSEKEKDILINCFDKYNIRGICASANDSTLVLTQRQWQYPVSEEETGLLYQYLCDYFCSNGNKVSIKPHPSDKYNHHDFFTNSVVFPVGFPADLLPIIKDFRIKTAITVSSTSIQRFSYWCDDLIICGNTYFRNWRYINKVYYALKCITEMGYGQSEVYRNNIPDGDDFLKLLRNHALSADIKESKWISLSSPFNGVAVVGRIVFDGKFLTSKQYYRMLENLSNDSIIIYLDINNEKNFIDFEHFGLLDYVYSFKITKEAIKEKVYCDLNDEYIHIFCKNKAVISKLFNEDFRIELINVGIRLQLKFVEQSPLREYVMYNKIKDLSKSGGYNLNG